MTKHKPKHTRRDRISLNAQPLPSRPASSDSFNLIHYLLNHIGDELMLIDHQARVVFVNDATVKGLAVPRDVLLRRRVIDFFKTKMSLRTWQKNVFNRIKRSPGPISYRVERRSGKGQLQTIDITAVYMPYKSEEYVLSVARDMTQDLALQSRLRETQDLYRLISEGAGDGIFACDLQGNLTYVNPALENLVGVSAENLKGRKFIDYIAKDSFSKALSCFNQAKEGANNIREELELVNNKHNRIPVEINVSPLFTNGRIVSIHAVVRDIRNRRHLEAIMRQSEKMQAIQMFVTGMAKEIKDPLFAVLALTKRLTERYQGRDFEYIGYNDFKDMMKAIDQIHSRAKYSYETTQRLLELSKKKSGIKRDFCQVNDVLPSALRSRQGQLKSSNIRVKSHLSPHLPAVLIGKIELAQAIDSIFNNAIQAMPGGGVLTIRSLFHRTLNKAEIDIQDTGVGISQEDLPHIFEPFFTTRQHGVTRSAGLGLSIVRELLKAVEGEIHVQSSLREGTGVTLMIPVRRGKSA